MGQNTFIYTYDPAHKHAVKTINFNQTDYSYTYDANGSMTSGHDFSDLNQVAIRTIGFNAENMPAWIEHTKGINTVRTDFLYDGDGVRAKKIVWWSSITYYIGEHFEKKDGVAIKYIFAGDMRIAKVEASDRYYYHKDHLGSSTAMTDATGVKVETTEYMPFGHMREHTGTVVTDYKFTDQELDPESGLYNYDARLYDSVIGRFVTADTIVPAPFDPQTLNRYSYCQNNPLIYVDPTGHYIEDEGPGNHMDGDYGDNDDGSDHDDRDGEHDIFVMETVVVTASRLFAESTGNSPFITFDLSFNSFLHDSQERANTRLLIEGGDIVTQGQLHVTLAFDVGGALATQMDIFYADVPLSNKLKATAYNAYGVLGIVGAIPTPKSVALGLAIDAHAFNKIESYLNPHSKYNLDRYQNGNN